MAVNGPCKSVATYTFVVANYVGRECIVGLLLLANQANCFNYSVLCICVRLGMPFALERA